MNKFKKTLTSLIFISVLGTSAISGSVIGFNHQDNVASISYSNTPIEKEDVFSAEVLNVNGHGSVLGTEGDMENEVDPEQDYVFLKWSIKPTINDNITQYFRRVVLTGSNLPNNQDEIVLGTDLTGDVVRTKRIGHLNEHVVFDDWKVTGYWKDYNTETGEISGDETVITRDIEPFNLYKYQEPTINKLEIKEEFDGYDKVLVTLNYDIETTDKNADDEIMLQNKVKSILLSTDDKYDYVSVLDPLQTGSLQLPVRYGSRTKLHLKINMTDPSVDVNLEDHYTGSMWTYDYTYDPDLFTDTVTLKSTQAGFYTFSFSEKYTEATLSVDGYNTDIINKWEFRYDGKKVENVTFWGDSVESSNDSGKFNDHVYIKVYPKDGRYDGSKMELFDENGEKFEGLTFDDVVIEFGDGGIISPMAIKLTVLIVIILSILAAIILAIVYIKKKKNEEQE